MPAIPLGIKFSEAVTKAVNEVYKVCKMDSSIIRKASLFEMLIFIFFNFVEGHPLTSDKTYYQVLGLNEHMDTLNFFYGYNMPDVPNKSINWALHLFSIFFEAKMSNDMVVKDKNKSLLVMLWEKDQPLYHKLKNVIDPTNMLANMLAVPDHADLA